MASLKPKAIKKYVKIFTVFVSFITKRFKKYLDFKKEHGVEIFMR
ncbi:hypothetical protein OENI_20229 [Oenococcus oeni]|nr:hypothetical protein OENI_20229 [Oenococcus oeni]